MRSNLAVGAFLRPVRIHPALRSAAAEFRAVLVRMLAYAGVLAVLAIMASHLFAEAQIAAAVEPPPKASWSAAARSYPAFAVSQFDLADKTESYDIFRHPEGGRKDVLRWATAQGEKPVAELEIYRPGGEVSKAGPPAADVAARMDPGGTPEIAAAGLIDSKFGPVTLLGFAGANSGARPCLGFMKNLDAVNLKISGWSCQADTIPALRNAIGCTLNRLILLTAGNDPKLAELFAHAELKRQGCRSDTSAPARSADWVMGAQNPQLRGSL